MPVAKPKYVIDTCSLTKLKRDYPLDVFPSIWDKVALLATDGTLISVEDVYEELSAIESTDELTDWADQHQEIFIALDDDIQIAATKILTTHANLIDLKKRKSGADPFVVATAQHLNCAVVTEEKPSGGPNKSKIPDVCKAYAIECFGILEMLRREALKL